MFRAIKVVFEVCCQSVLPMNPYVVVFLLNVVDSVVILYPNPYINVTYEMQSIFLHFKCIPHRIRHIVYQTEEQF